MFAILATKRRRTDACKVGPKRKRGESDPAFVLSGIPAVRQRVVPVRGCRDTVLMLEVTEYVPRKATPSGAESDVPLDPVWAVFWCSSCTTGVTTLCPIT
jgi:hypothetical protein